MDDPSPVEKFTSSTDACHTSLERIPFSDAGPSQGAHLRGDAAHHTGIGMKLLSYLGHLRNESSPPQKEHEPTRISQLLRELIEEESITTVEKIFNLDNPSC